MQHQNSLDDDKKEGYIIKEGKKNKAIITRSEGKLNSFCKGGLCSLVTIDNFQE